jgi:NADPH:quinone reductase-like Zn-dependent oxidoreductase
MKAATGAAGRAATPADTGGGTAPASARPTMRAIVQAGYGSADVLHLAEIGRPAAAGGEVLLRVHAAGLDRGTGHLMAGQPYAIRLVSGLRAPKNPVPGLDVAGTVVAAGADVTGFAAGDEVFGIGHGSFAEYARARPGKLARKPASLTFGQAAAVAISGLTALQGLRDAGRLRPGQHVLITGASGGVGTFAVQIAKALGARVTGVCSTAKTGLVSSIGADHVLDYTRDDFAAGPQRYDLILDIAGNAPLARLRHALTPAGTLVLAGGEDGGRWTGMSRQVRALARSPFTRQRLTMLISRQRGADLETLARLIEAGQVTPVIGKTYPLHQAPDAIRDLLAGHARGKLVITVTDTG